MYNRIQPLKPYLYLLLILFVAFLPLSSFHFGMKNDAFSDNFPNKYFLSQALHAGMMPLWNSYLNFGFPVYADPGFAFWNPVTWLFAAIGYTAYSLTAEVLFYLYLAGILMYRLCRYFRFSNGIALVIATMYMCSGFFVGSLQYINFLTAAAFLPLLILSYSQCLEKPGFQNSFWLAACGYLLFTAGHPAIPFATVYFLFLFTLFHYLFNKQRWVNYRAKLLALLTAFVLFLLLASPALYSYSTVFADYSRDSASQAGSLANTGFSPASYLSFFLPFSTIVRHGVFIDDVAMRNAFISVAGIIAAAGALFLRDKKGRVFFITGCVMLIIAVGGGFKIALYEHLPLLNYVRTNGEFRLFSVFCFCLSAGYFLNEFGTSRRLKKGFLTALKIVWVALLVLACVALVISFPALRELAVKLSQAGSVTEKVKSILDNGSFTFFLSLSTTIELLLLTAGIYLLNKNRFRYFTVCIIADVVINAVLYLPVTGVGQVTLNSIQHFYDSNPDGIPIPPLTPIRQIDTLDPIITGLVGDITYYNKKIGTQKLTDYPSYFKNTGAFFKSSVKDSILQMPYVFRQSDLTYGRTGASIQVGHFSPTSLQFIVLSPGVDTLILLQNYYRYWSARVNDKQVPVTKKYVTFMGIPLQQGNNVVTFSYRDPYLPVFLLLSAGTFIIGIIIILRSKNIAYPAEH